MGKVCADGFSAAEKKSINTSMYMEETLNKEIDLIQNCINRMADCSFKIKGWFITIISVVLALLFGQKCDTKIIILFIFVITGIFWYLDGFFLQQETFYRWKYEWVIKKRLEDNQMYLYDLNPVNKEMWLEPENKKPFIIKYILSKTLFPLYGTLWLISAGVIIYLIFVI